MEGELATSPERGETACADPPAGRVATFSRALRRLAPFTLESKLQGELVAEAATVLDAFGRATDPVGVREGLALAALLGRRSAEVGASAVEVAAMLEALLEVLVECLSPADRQGLRGLVIDGYTRAHIEREREAQVQARVRATRPLLLAPRVVMHVLQGSADGDWVGAACESLGPALLRADARALVVVAQLDGETSDACLAELCALVDLADVVGARVIIVASEGIVQALRERIQEQAILVTDDVAKAVAEALSLASSSTDSVRARVAGLLKRLGV